MILNYGIYLSHLGVYKEPGGPQLTEGGGVGPCVFIKFSGLF